MKKYKFFGKYFLIFGTNASLFIVISFFSSLRLTTSQASSVFSTIGLTFSNIVNESDLSLELSLDKLKKSLPNNIFFDVFLVDEEGYSVSANKKITSGLSEDEKEILNKNGFLLRDNFSAKKPEAFYKSKLQGTYLCVVIVDDKNTVPKVFLTILVILLGSTFFSIFISLQILFSDYKKRAIEAVHIIQKMKSGDLKSRIEIRKFDELGHLVFAFNQMADELERTVTGLQNTDLKRRELFQELAHDLRTPLASIKAFSELLLEDYKKISEEKRGKALRFILIEVNYFSKLMEDLLFLSQITEPQHILANDRINLNEVVSYQISSISALFPKIKFLFVAETKEDVIQLGSEILFNRLIKNALMNAGSFAASEVKVYLNTANQNIFILIQDDGPGFSAEALENFGYRRSTRKLREVESKDNQRISNGVGSIIMREIVKNMSGTLEVNNLKSNSNETCGATLIVTLKKLKDFTNV